MAQGEHAEKLNKLKPVAQSSCSSLAAPCPAAEIAGIWRVSITQLPVSPAHGYEMGNPSRALLPCPASHHPGFHLEDISKTSVPSDLL